MYAGSNLIERQAFFCFGRSTLVRATKPTLPQLKINNLSAYLAIIQSQMMVKLVKITTIHDNATAQNCLECEA